MSFRCVRSCAQADLAGHDPLQEALAEVVRLRELAYAPDGKEHRSMVFEEAAKRLPLEAALIEMRQRDDRNGSLPAAYREIIDKALSRT